MSNRTTPSAAKAPLRIGVLYEETQMSDLTGLDILGNCSSRMLDLGAAGGVPGADILAPLAVPMEFFYICSDTEKSWTSPDMHVRATHTYEDAPRDLDILLLGGPNPMTVSDASLTFLKEAALKTKFILTTCTGGMWLARSGVLDGKKATTNRMMLETAKQAMPSVEWQDVKWVSDQGLFEGAEIWTAGGAGCGEYDLFSLRVHSFEIKLIHD
ncbi:hypothetical protein DM02DRAFT_703267 [Periconia macrospinosa]|uniref:DJ-1/PfpI domain-containing protein n=1 Tax=Periconia macrospinosa TaxID=97972 RepID=A0A2V1E9Z5_9PLEO|nr:hypothetical protein DM02DRAFT_703267 [Periconia macrospinosa]